jgi:hypothetical protein
MGGYSVIVTDEHGAEVGRVPVAGLVAIAWLIGRAPTFIQILAYVAVGEMVARHTLVLIRVERAHRKKAIVELCVISRPETGRKERPTSYTAGANSWSLGVEGGRRPCVGLSFRSLASSGAVKIAHSRTSCAANAVG